MNAMARPVPNFYPTCLRGLPDRYGIIMGWVLYNVRCLVLPNKPVTLRVPKELAKNEANSAIAQMVPDPVRTDKGGSSRSMFPVSCFLRIP